MDRTDCLVIKTTLRTENVLPVQSDFNINTVQEVHTVSYTITAAAHTQCSSLRPLCPWIQAVRRLHAL